MAISGLDPHTPVLVGVAQLNGTGDCEPVAMMAEVVRAALADAGGSGLGSMVGSVGVVKGVWPYQNPAALVAEQVGLTPTETLLTAQISGSSVYEVINRSAEMILAGDQDAVVVCGAETMRTRRRDRSVDKRSTYLDEPEETRADVVYGSDEPLGEKRDWDAGLVNAVNYYAMAESANRHRLGYSVEEHQALLGDLWARANDVAISNPHAWLTDVQTADAISQPSEQNRFVATPYTKLLTSNINVDQAAAVVLCSVEAARAAGISSDRWVFPLSGTVAYDPLFSRSRWALDESPAIRVAGARAAELVGLSPGDFGLRDLYSCFPIAVQVAQRELGLDPAAPFTLTGGMTFAGGPFGTYCLHPLATAIEALRGTDQRAFLSGNGGFLTKHSFLTLGAEPGVGFHFEQCQGAVDQLPTRPLRSDTPENAIIEAHTVLFGREAVPKRVLFSVIDDAGSRSWAESHDVDAMEQALTTDLCGSAAKLTPGNPATLTLD